MHTARRMIGFCEQCVISWKNLSRCGSHNSAWLNLSAHQTAFGEEVNRLDCLFWFFFFFYLCLCGLWSERTVNICTDGFIFSCIIYLVCDSIPRRLRLHCIPENWQKKKFHRVLSLGIFFRMTLYYFGQN